MSTNVGNIMKENFLSWIRTKQPFFPPPDLKCTSITQQQEFPVEQDESLGSISLTWTLPPHPPQQVSPKLNAHARHNTSLPPSVFIRIAAVTDAG